MWDIAQCNRLPCVQLLCKKEEAKDLPGVSAPSVPLMDPAAISAAAAANLAALKNAGCALYSTCPYECATSPANGCGGGAGDSETCPAAQLNDCCNLKQTAEEMMENLNNVCRGVVDEDHQPIPPPRRASGPKSQMQQQQPQQQQQTCHTMHYKPIMKTRQALDEFGKEKGKSSIHSPIYNVIWGPTGDFYRQLTAPQTHLIA